MGFLFLICCIFNKYNIGAYEEGYKNTRNSLWEKEMENKYFLEDGLIKNQNE